MIQTQSVIVYRNRVEHDLYENGLIFPIVVFVLVTAAMAVILSSIGEWVAKKCKWSLYSWQRTWVSYAAVGFSVVLGAFALFAMLP